MVSLTMSDAFFGSPSLSIVSSTALCVSLETLDQSLLTSSNPLIFMLPVSERSAYFFFAPRLLSFPPFVAYEHPPAVEVLELEFHRRWEL